LHWKLSIDGDVATLVMAVAEDKPLRPGYRLKLNSYDLGVDSSSTTRCSACASSIPRCARVISRRARPGLLRRREHQHARGLDARFKVNFCKFTNETRLAIEDASRTRAALPRGAERHVRRRRYELALACDEILLVDDGNSAVSLPEVPLLGVLPGTGGLTRLVDKRKVRRDLADVFCTWPKA
jgi:benzoyl-CoA-dihydrodiol lyase